MNPQHAFKSLLLSVSIGLCLSAADVGAATPGAGTVADATSTAIDPSAQALLDQIEAIFGPSVSLTERNMQLASQAHISETAWSTLARSAINPSDYQCGGTKLTTWLSAQIPELDLEDQVMLAYSDVTMLAAYEAILFGQESKSNSFGIDGQYTHLLTSEMKDLRRFWDIPSAHIRLLPMHGDILTDVERMARVYRAADVSDEEAREIAQNIADWIKSNPWTQGGKHPIFTFNAFAHNDETGDGEAIVMGDGVMQGFDAIGLGALAPRAILGHEFGHQVQYANNLFESDLTGPEAGRRTELMADAFGTYFLVHARGEALNAKRTLSSLQSFYELGDCDFTNADHHGTPLQRLRAATWSADLANNARPQGHIRPSIVFAAEFDNKLSELIAPDAK